MTRAIPVLAISAALLLAAQLVPLRVSNPPVVQPPTWDEATADLARKACFDCHSNEVQVPWYGHVAPVSWVVRHHVEEGRHELNFSEMHREQEEAHEAAEAVRDGEMPPAYYTLMHPEARLSDADRAALAEGLAAALGDD